MSDVNPYAAPGASLEPDIPPGRRAFTLRQPRSVPAGHGWTWLAEGFGLFRKNPGAWILAMLAGFAIMIAMVFVPIVGQLAMSATYYVWIGGFMIGCHAQTQGEAFRVQHLFAGFARPKKLILISVLVSLIGMGIMFVALGPLYLKMLRGGVEPDPQMVQAITDPIGFWLPLLFGMLFTIPLMMAVWFTPALIAINDVPVLAALKMSFKGCLKNILPFLIYGVLGMLLYILGAIPLLLGLLVVVPMLLASIYTSYKDIFLEPADDNPA